VKAPAAAARAASASEGRDTATSAGFSGFTVRAEVSTGSFMSIRVPPKDSCNFSQAFMALSGMERPLFGRSRGLSGMATPCLRRHRAYLSCA
jgi:hypothetical protein